MKRGLVIGTLIGMWLGSLIFQVIGNLLHLSTPFILFAGFIVGAFVGANIGNNIEEKKEENGEETKRPLLKIGIIGFFSTLGIFILYLVFALSAGFFLDISESTGYIFMGIMSLVGFVFLISLVLIIVGLFVKKKEERPNKN